MLGAQKRGCSIEVEHGRRVTVRGRLRSDRLPRQGLIQVRIRACAPCREEGYSGIEVETLKVPTPERIRSRHHGVGDCSIVTRQFVRLCIGSSVCFSYLVGSDRGIRPGRRLVDADADPVVVRVVLRVWFGSERLDRRCLAMYPIVTFPLANAFYDQHVRRKRSEASCLQPVLFVHEGPGSQRLLERLHRVRVVADPQLGLAVTALREAFVVIVILFQRLLLSFPLFLTRVTPRFPYCLH